MAEQKVIYVTGDTHRNVNKAKLLNFDYSGLTKSDYIIICGDFGFIWFGKFVGIRYFWKNHAGFIKING